MKKTQVQTASALLVSVVLMSFVMSSALLFYHLVFKDIALFRSWKSESQLHYANRGMQAWALAELREHLAGYEPEAMSYTFPQNVQASFEVKAQGESTPCLKEEEWSYLKSQESVHHPLFTENKDGSIREIHRFLVEFFLIDQSGQAVRAQGPLLRWKILGLEKMSQETQAISEFIPLDLSGDRFRPERPTIFGPGYEGEVLAPNYTHAKFFQTEPSYAYYEAYSIQDFLQNHESNTLVLTSALGPEYGSYQIAYRVKGNHEKVVCPQAEIVTQAKQGDQSRQERLIFPYAESLPVFDFVLYHTKE